MDAQPLPARLDLAAWDAAPGDLVRAYNDGNPGALRRLHRGFGFRGKLTKAKVRHDVQHILEDHDHRRTAALTLGEGKWIVATVFGFSSWAALRNHVRTASQPDSAVSRVERAADAVVAGDTKTLRELLRTHPELAGARSTRRHGATLLHYVSANGVENFRQRTPKNAVEVARILVGAGAEVDATLRDRKSTTLGLVATSLHPLRAGVQRKLLRFLQAAGASVEGVKGGWTPLAAALDNQRREAAEWLARHGARIDNLLVAAALGRLDKVKSLYKPARAGPALIMAARFGRTAAARFLLDKGADVNAKDKIGMTPLHWAAASGSIPTVKLLLQNKASLEAKNMYGGTVLGSTLWSAHYSPIDGADYPKVVERLLKEGADVSPIPHRLRIQRLDALVRRYRSKKRARRAT